jgi:hypothetical protein
MSRLRATLACLLAASWAGIWSGTALASDCNNSTEQGYWVRSSDFPTYGSQATVPQVDRTLAFDCQGSAENHHMAHIRNSSFTNQAEIGYLENWGPLSSHAFWIFWEVEIGTAMYGGFSTESVIGCCTTYVFRVVNVPTNTNWKFYYKPSGGTMTQFGPANGQDAAFSQGYPFGEDARVGDPGTSAADKHTNLRYKAVRSCTSNCWGSVWSTNFLHTGCIPGWSYQFIDRDTFEVVSDSSHTC